VRILVPVSGKRGQVSPSREQQLILLSAGTAARRTRERARAERLSDQLDWQAMADSLTRMRLLGTLGPRLLELAGAPASRQFELRLAETLATGRRHGAFLQMIAQRAIELLGAAGIRVSPVKGPQLGEALYGDPGRRSSSDIDLLVESNRLGEAAEVTRQLGYAAPDDRVDEHGLPLLHFALLHERAELPPIELHWRIHWYESRFAQERLLTPRGERAGAWRPAAVDELAALLLFYARDGFMALRHACDIGAWWDAYGAQLEPRQLEELLAAYPELRPVLRTALTVAEDTVGLPALQIAGHRLRLRARERVARRLPSARTNRSEAQQFAQMGLIDGLLAPPGGLRAFAGRQLTPPATARASDATPRPAQIGAGHGLRVLLRYGLALLGLLRGRRAPGARSRRVDALHRA
jgi:Uncharacterised nucleotidyltransferase